jgi:hypothetical protein
MCEKSREWAPLGPMPDVMTRTAFRRRKTQGLGRRGSWVEVGWKAWMRQIEVAESEIRSRGADLSNHVTSPPKPALYGMYVLRCWRSDIVPKFAHDTGWREAKYTHIYKESKRESSRMELKWSKVQATVPPSIPNWYHSAAFKTARSLNQR